MENTTYNTEYKTRFNPATDTKGESVTLFFNGSQKTYPYDYSLNGFENHVQLCESHLKDFFNGYDIVYSNILMIKELKRGYKFKGTIEIKGKLGV